MQIYSLINILIFLGFCFGIYKLCRRISIKRNARPLWPLEDETILKDVLGRIYASVSLDNLKSVFGEGVRHYPIYHDLFNIARQERQQEITQVNSGPSFETRERKIRKLWILSFFILYFPNWFFIVISPFFSEFPVNAHVLASGLLFTAFMVGVGWIIYHCAYKKKGTGLLLFLLIIGPLLNLSSYSKEGIDLSMWYITFFDVALYTFFWVSSFRLRKINCEILPRRQLKDLKCLL